MLTKNLKELFIYRVHRSSLKRNILLKGIMCVIYKYHIHIPTSTVSPSEYYKQFADIIV